MPFVIMKDSLRWHVFLLLKALLIFLLLALGIVFFIFPTEVELLEKYKTISFEHYYPIFSDERDEAYHALKYALANGQIVLFGSSELSQYDSSFIPYNFFSESLGIPVYGFGHAGFQARAIETELLASVTQNAIDNGKIVILISPSWFIEGTGTNESLWKKEILTTTMSSRIRENKFANGYFKQNIDFEKNDKYTDNLDRLIVKIIDTYFLWSMSFEKPKNEIFTDLKWSELKIDAQKIETSKSTNQFGINDEYFDEYIKSLVGTEKFPLKIKGPPRVEDNKEVKDFESLLQILSKFKVRPIFIMLPLNKKAYSNTIELNPTISYLAEKIKKEGYPYLDMWSQPFEPGVMTDVMHLGEYGLMLINEFIDQNLKK